MEGLDYGRFHTEIFRQHWRIALDAGFFRGEVASIQAVRPWLPACGGRDVRYSEGVWTPVVMAGGEVMLAAEFFPIEESAYLAVPEACRIQVVTMDELLS